MARRSTVWIPFFATHTPSASTTTDEGTDLLANLGDTGLQTRRDMTIVRIRGRMRIRNVSTPLADNQIFNALMIAHEGENLAQTNLLSALVTSPIWRHEDFGPMITQEVAAGDFDPVPQFVPIDTRAMRKLDRSNNELHLVTGLSAGSTVQVSISGTILLMLP